MKNAPSHCNTCTVPKFLLVERAPVTSIQIIGAICKYFDIDQSKVLGQKRDKEIVYARHFCMVMIKNHTNMTLKGIGSIFNRHHSTVINARVSIYDQVNSKVNNWYQIDFNRLTSIINDL